MKVQGTPFGRWLATLMLLTVSGTISVSSAFADWPTSSVADAATVDESWHLQVRPQGFLYHTYWASASEPRLATHLVRNMNDGNLLDSHVGGRVGLLRYGSSVFPEGFQIDVLGGAKLRQDWDNGLDVVATDFRYDILGSYARGNHRIKLGFYHVSAHAGDEFLLANPGFERLNFFRDALVAGYSYYPHPNLRLYAEAGWAFQHEFSEPWEFQFGVDYGPSSGTGLRGAPFFAINTHLRQELDFGGNLAAQLGWAWKSDRPGDGVLRTGAYYYNGGSPQFSFYTQHEQQAGWGIWYDF